jgi:8-oxo-dGTP pyrophosphatase MutT (NUDIX family)
MIPDDPLDHPLDDPPELSPFDLSQLDLPDPNGEACEPFDAFFTDLARAADLCLRPHRHALRFSGEAPARIGDCSDCCLLIEALMLTRLADDQAPLLWHGHHPVWMQAASGERCERPADGAPFEAFCRRVRALLSGE